MRIAIPLIIVLTSLVSPPARAERVKIGGYSGKPGYFALVGQDFGLRLDLVIMNLEAREALRKALGKDVPLGGTKTCEVEGQQQAIGTQTFYSLFKVMSCK